MSFLVTKFPSSKKWWKAVIYLLVFSFSTGCATPELKKSEDNSTLAQAKFKAALQAGSLNQQDKMLALLIEAVELDSADPNFHFYLGRTYFVRGDLERAEREYLTSIALNKNLNDSYQQLGLLYMKQGNWEKAIRNFRENLDRPGTQQPQQVYNWIALCYFNLGKKNEAEIEWKKALEIKDNAGIRLNLALAYINQERFDLAVKFLQRALSLKPRFSQAHFELAQLYLKDKKKDQALKHLEKVILFSPRGELAKKSKEYIQLISPD